MAFRTISKMIVRIYLVNMKFWRVWYINHIKLCSVGNLNTCWMRVNVPITTHLQGKTWKLEHNIKLGHMLCIHSHKQEFLHPLEIQSVCIYGIDISLLCKERAFKLLHSPTAASGGANISFLHSKFTLLSLN